MLMLDPELAEERQNEIVSAHQGSRPEAGGPGSARRAGAEEVAYEVDKKAEGPTTSSTSTPTLRRSKKSRESSGSPTARCGTSPYGARGRGARRASRRAASIRTNVRKRRLVANINRVVLVGNLTKDPELRHTSSGTAVCKLRLAVNTRQKDSSTGEWGGQAELLRRHRLGEPGESCAQYLSKGRPVGVDGRLDWREGGAGRLQAPSGRDHRRQRAVPRIARERRGRAVSVHPPPT